MTANPASPPPAGTNTLADLWKNGDIASAERLFAKFTRTLAAWGRVQIRPTLRRWFDEEDFVQETWGQVLEALPRFDRAGSFRGLLFTIANRVFFRHCERAGREGRNLAVQGDATAPGTISSIPAPTTTPGRWVAKWDLKLKLVDAVVRIIDEKDGERSGAGALNRLLFCRWLEGVPYVEIAKELNLSETNVGTKLTRLRAALREAVDPGLLEDLSALGEI